MTEPTTPTPQCETHDWCLGTHQEPDLHAGDLVFGGQVAGKNIYTRPRVKGDGAPGIEVVVAEVNGSGEHRVQVAPEGVLEHIALQRQMTAELDELLAPHGTIDEGGAQK